MSRLANTEAAKWVIGISGWVITMGLCSFPRVSASGVLQFLKAIQLYL